MPHFLPVQDISTWTSSFEKPRLPYGFPVEEQLRRGFPQFEADKLVSDNILADRNAELLQLACSEGMGSMLEHPWP